MKVRMWPDARTLQNFNNGIAQTVKSYQEHLPKFGVEFVLDEKEADLRVSHAASQDRADVHHSHGLIWTGQDPSLDYTINRDLVRAIKQARQVTVPSSWVAEVFWRDMKFRPHIIPHGINHLEWQHTLPNEGYILWGKNRVTDGIDPSIVGVLAEQFPHLQFVSTFGINGMPANVKVIGQVDHREMKVLIQQAAVMLSTTKETFGIMNLEALASGTPILALNSGSVLSRHGLDGYNYSPYAPIDDLFFGLDYCLKNRSWLSGNAQERAKEFSWEQVSKMVMGVYKEALIPDSATVAVVIPCHNYGHVVKRAIQSALAQTYPISQVIVVDDGSTDNSREMVKSIQDERVIYVYQDNAGVAEARNKGFGLAHTQYVVPLDADDAIEPGFVQLLVEEMKAKPYLGVAYTGIKVVLLDGSIVYPETRPESPWPAPMDFDKQLNRWNQVPTCALVRRSYFERVGGYKSRYCPEGAGVEDGELWLRMGEYGYGLSFVPSQEGARFVHYTGKGHVSGRTAPAIDVDWTAWHPWANGYPHLFASIAQPVQASHPVRAYDEPAVSVIIPVGPGHEKAVQTALDSLEAQTMYGWEAIVVWDSPLTNPDDYLKSYPYARVVKTKDKHGAGVARNLGVKKARAMLIAYLDADDYYSPDYLRKSLIAFSKTGQAVYSDFASKLSHNQQKQYNGTVIKELPSHVIVNDSFSDFDCQRANERPNGERPYVWTGITILLPKIWHVQIGGFDENLETWEDCDYLLRLAWAGHCFHHIQEMLWLYDFSSGKRRDKHVEQTTALMNYLQDKYDEVKGNVQL